MSISIDRVGWKNGTSPAVNETNLKNMENNAENGINELGDIVNGEVVYGSDTSSGTQLVANFSKSISGYKSIVIFYKNTTYSDNVVTKSIRVDSPVGKTVELSNIIAAENGNMLRLESVLASIQSDKVMLLTSSSGHVCIYTGKINEYNNVNNIYIYKVVAYKEA